MSLALETLEAPVRIVGLDGRILSGSLFLHSIGDSGSRLETIGGRLGDPATHFLPVRIGGQVELINVSWMAYVSVAGRSEEISAGEEIGARRARAELELANGQTVSGELLYALPEGHARVSDLLNSPGERFVLLLAESETLYVNRAAIVRARGG